MIKNSNAYKILKELVIKNEEISAINLSKNLNVPHKQINNATSYLVSKGLIKKIKVGSKCFYKIRKCNIEDAKYRIIHATENEIGMDKNQE